MTHPEQLPADSPHQASLREQHEAEVRQLYTGITEKDVKAIADLRIRRGTPTAADIALASELEQFEPLRDGVVRAAPHNDGRYEFPTRFGSHTTALGGDEHLTGDIMG